MRPKLQLITDRRRQSGSSTRRPGTPAPRPRGVDSATRPHVALTPEPAPLREDLQRPDADFSRAREAGGPEDVAHYSCCCGYMFAADVTTTVDCPHCGTAQAW